MNMGWFRAFSLALALVFAGTAAHAQAAGPAAQAVQPVQTFYDALLTTMKDGKQLGIKGRYDKLKPVIEHTFDLPGMTRLSIGPVWNNMSKKDQQSLIAALTRYTVASYASNFSSYDGEKFVVDPTSTERGTDRIVTTKLVTKDETIPFVYRMRQVDSKWQVIDIFLNGYVSQIAKQRSDFSATVQSGGAPALVKKLNALSDKLLKG